MAYQIVGNDLVLGDTYYSDNVTIIDLTSSFPGRGILKLFSVYAGDPTPTAFKIKVFRDDGTNYVFIGESPAYSLSALQINADLRCWIAAEKNDLLGFYVDAARYVRATSSGSSVHKAGDIITTSLKSGWGSLTRKPSTQGKIFTRVAPL